MMKNWKLTENVYVFYSYDSTTVCLANPEEKKSLGLIKKQSESTKDPILIVNKDFKVKFESGYIKINNPEFENPEKYYTLGNIDKEDIIYFLEDLTIEKGIVTDICIAFNSLEPGNVKLIKIGTKNYEIAESNMIRSISLSLYKKTTKYIPGTKYLTETQDLYYLGTVISHKKNKSSSDYYYTAENTTRTLFAFSTSIPKSVEEAFLDYKIIETFDIKLIPDNYIVLLDSRKSFVEDKKYFDVSDFSLEDLWEEKLNRYMNNVIPYSVLSKRTRYSKNLGELFDYFSITSDIVPNKELDIKLKTRIEEIISNLLTWTLFMYYDLQINYYSENILSTDPIDIQTSNLSALFITKVLSKSNGLFRIKKYFEDTLKTLFDINLEELAKSCITDFLTIKPTESQLESQDITDYLDNVSWYEYREPEKYNKEIDFIFCNEKKRKFECFLPSNLSNVIKDIYTRAIETGGLGVTTFLINNIGTRSNIILEYYVDIMIPDIINYFGIETPQELPEEIRSEIINDRIYKITINSRNNIEIK